MSRVIDIESHLAAVISACDALSNACEAALAAYDEAEYEEAEARYQLGMQSAFAEASRMSPLSAAIRSVVGMVRRD